MLTAFLLVNTEIGSESRVLEKLKTIDNVKEAYLVYGVYVVYGVYDILVKITVQSMGELKEIITSPLLRSNEIQSSTTMIIIPQKQSLNTRTAEVLVRIV